MEVFNVIVRILHIGSAIALLGGTVFFLVVLIPSLKLLDDGLRGSILQIARKRFYRISHPALVLLLLTGFYNFYLNLGIYGKAHKAVHALIGIKILLALAVVFIVFAQTFGVLKGCPIRWAKINLALGVTIVILAAIVRALRMAAMTG